MKASGSKASRVARQFRRRGLRFVLLAVGLVTLQASECSKDDFYDALGVVGTADNTPTLITDFLPMTGVTLNDVVVMATITDPQGSNGATPTGVDASSIEAIGEDGADLAITTSGTNMYNADIAAWADGPHTINWAALDFAGNEGTGTQSIEIDRTDPALTVNPTPPASATSDDLQFTWTVGINIVEPNFLDATYRVRFAGPDNQCGTGDDVTPSAQQVPTSTFELDAGANTVEVVTNNGVAPGGQPMTAIYCGSVFARDDAVTKTGGEASNTTTSMQFRTELIWQPPSGGGDFTVGLGDLRWEHTMPGVESVECKTVSTTPAQAGATWSATVSGPGVISGQTFGGTLDANGRAALRVRINQFGTYTNNVTVTAGSVTRNASASVTVEPAANTCVVLQSSARFKRGVVALLPDDVRPLGLNPVAFRYVEPYGDPSVPRIGLIAEDVVGVFPEAVLLDAEGRPLAIDYGVLTRSVVKEVESQAVQAVEAAIGRLAD